MFYYQLARVKMQDAFREVEKMSLLRIANQSQKANYQQRLVKLFQCFRLTRNHLYEGSVDSQIFQDTSSAAPPIRHELLDFCICIIGDSGAEDNIN